MIMAESESKKYVQQFERYYTNDDPVPYKELLIYPVKAKDYYDFYMAVNILTIEKDKIPNPKIIRMPYLDFIFYQIENDENRDFYLYAFLQIMKLCLRIDSKNIKYRYNENNRIELIVSIQIRDEFDKTKFFYKLFTLEQMAKFIKSNVDIVEKIKNKEIAFLSQICDINIDSAIKLIDIYQDYLQNNMIDKDIIINSEDFDNIRYILIYQNLPDYDDTYIDPKVEASLKEAQEFLNRNKGKMCSFEDQQVAINNINGMHFEDIHNLSLRKFSKIIEHAIARENYVICETAKMSGMVEFKQDIKHWLEEKKHTKYQEILIDFDETKSKLGQGNSLR